MLSSEKEPITLEERVVTAIVSAVTAALTLLAYFIINFALAAKSMSGMPLVSSFFFSKFSAYIVATATIVGFVVGTERMAQLFSFFWGTHEIWEREWFQKLCVIFIIATAVIMVVHLLHDTRAPS